MYGGTAPYTVNNLTQGTSETGFSNGDIYIANNLAAGTYDIQFLDATGAQVPMTVTVDQSDGIIIDGTIVDPSCADLSNGSINVQVQGGTPFAGDNYIFKWSHSLIDFTTNSIATNLANGNYSVTVTDSLGCETMQDFTVLREELGIVANLDQPLCDGELGSITVNASGGSGFYSASLLGVPFQSDFNFTTSTTFSNLDPGTYTIGLEDNQTDGCMITEMVVLSFQNSIIYDPVITDVDCQAQTMDLEITFSNTSGSVSSYDVQITDLVGPSLYMNASTGSGTILTLTDVPFSDYQIEVLSSEGCTLDTLLPSVQATGALSLAEPPVISMPCENDNNGSISLNVLSGSGSAINWGWNTGETGTDTFIQLSNLSSGTYSITISNSDGCQITEDIMLDSIGINITSASNNAIACTDATGDITAEAQGGSEPYAFVWDHPNNSNMATLSNVLAGNSYTVTVTDANGCTSEQDLSLNAADAVTLSLLNSTIPTCHDLTNGTAESEAIGGTGNGTYNYSWSDGLLETTSTSSFNFDLSGGEHWVIADDGTCTSDTLFFSIAEGNRYIVDTAASTINPPDCEGETTGFVFIEVTPNVAGTSYNYSFPDLGIFNSANPSQGNLGTGDIRVIIEDSNGCANEDTIRISAPNPLTARVDSIASLLPVCSNDDLATVVIDVNGGTGSFSFNWTNTNSTSNTAEDLGVGNYSVIVSDENGCSAEVSDINISLPPPIVATVEPFDPRCFGDPGGILVSDASGGSGENFTFQVNTDPTVPVGDTAVIFPGTYTVRVYDSEGCNFESQPILIPQAPELSVDLGPDRNIDLGSSAEIDAFPVTSLPLIDVLWTPLDDLEFISNNNLEVTVSPTSDRVYELFISDENGCTASDEVLVRVERNVSVYVPNVFNIDESSQNRRMKVFAGSGVAVINFIKIYDRWGSLLREMSNIPPNIFGIEVWDGTTESQDLNSGVYVYVLEYTLIDGSSDIISGDVTLMR